MLVHVRVGPLSASGARAWLGYASAVLDAIQSRRTPLEPLPDDLAGDFRRYLAEWDEAAATDPFEWDAEEDRDRIAALATAWLELMAQVSGRVTELGLPVGPAEGEGFYHALVAALGEALAAGEDHLGDKLREAWPALGEFDVANASAASAGRRLRVVIADDASDLRAVVRIALESDGRFDVVAEARDGVEAVEACEEHTPDVVLLDVVMPRMDGWTALRRIRQQCPSASVVVVSTLDASSAADKAAELGAAAYVQKSISLVSLTDTIARLAS